MNIFSYSIKKSDREELEQELGKRLTDVEYNSIVNSVNSIKDNLNKIDLASILSPTETEAPKKPVEEKSNPKSSGSVAASSLSLSPPVSPNSSQKSNSTSSPSPSPSPISTKSNAGSQSNKSFNTKIPIAYSNFETPTKRSPLINRLSKTSSNNRFVSENQDWEQKYLKYKNKYLSLKQKIEN